MYAARACSLNLWHPRGDFSVSEMSYIRINLRGRVDGNAASSQG
jgi:hypothetical protein